jgi:hypothetical protein
MTHEHLIKQLSNDLDTSPRRGVQHGITTYCTAAGWTWSCRCGAEGSGTGAPTQTSAYAYGERHIRHALRKMTGAHVDHPSYR